jgi:hypothetical protein
VDRAVLRLRGTRLALPAQFRWRRPALAERGIGYAVAVRYGLRWTAVVAVGSLLYALQLNQPSPLYMLLVVAGKTAATAIAAWYVLRSRVLHLRTDDGMRMLGGGVILSVLSASFGLFAMQQVGQMDYASTPEAFIRWALGDMLGIAVVCPHLVLATTSRNPLHRLSPFHEPASRRERMFWLALLGHELHRHPRARRPRHLRARHDQPVAGAAPVVRAAFRACVDGGGNRRDRHLFQRLGRTGSGWIHRAQSLVETAVLLLLLCLWR